MTPCVDMAAPAVSLAETSVAEAWKKITDERKNLPLHTECAGCALRPVCDVCYANASNEKAHCGNLHYLCDIAKAKKELLIRESNRYETK